MDSKQLFKQAEQARSLAIVLRDALHSENPDQKQYLPAIALLGELVAAVYDQENLLLSGWKGGSIDNEHD